MRLVCPNCDAKYEVPDDAIPDGGRDVQCSACGHAWFQMPYDPDALARELAETVDLAEAPLTPPAVSTERETASDDADQALVSALAAAMSDDSEPATAPQVAPAAETPPPLPAAAREVDGEVLAILREEADRETEARRAEAQRDGTRKADAEGQMQVQPDLGMADPAPALTPTQRRLAMLQGKDTESQPAEAEAVDEPVKTARRDLLPDVEEINSTLQPGDAYDPDAEVDALPDLMNRRSGFRSGFLLVFLLLVAAALVYVMAPNLGRQFPGMKETLDGYIDFIDGLRVWLNDQMNSATAMLNGKEG